MQPSKRVTLRDIADVAGLSVAAVSKALRGLGDISPATRERVNEIAQQLGYRRDPALGALAMYRFQQTLESSGWQAIAFLHNWESLELLERAAFYRDLMRTLREEVMRRGFSFEPHSVGRNCENLPSVLRQLRHRGVQGIILGPLPPTGEPLPIVVEDDSFEVVTLGPSDLYPQHHTVQSDYWENFQQLWREVRARGYQRIGLYLPKETVWRTGGAWLGGYLEHQHQDKQITVIPPLLHTHEDSGQFLRWFHRHQPDVVLSVNGWPVEWLRAEGLDVPGDAGVALIAVAGEPCTGIDALPEVLGTSAAEMAEVLLHRRIIRDRRNPTPLRMHVAGRWKEAGTLRPKSE
ncbi:MAG: LacI family DNA-binding transcriptional regulator [Verrucomicrobia bacterium]|nr:LacI family DNA-binding transcriptional regulator [Verrucomicrobiota bacterium]MCH8510039.1 LacI family transcriptional regulator [Kiritimatiellia bacterium]